MIARRAVLASGASLLILPSKAAEPRLSLTGAQSQGALMIGRAPGATVTVDGAAVLVSPEGLFAFGLSFDQTKPTKLIAKFADRSSETSDVVPAVRHYEVQKVSGLPQKFVTPPPADLARIKQEGAMITATRQADTAGIGFSQPFDWPFPGILSGVYGSQRIDNGTKMAPHLGVDIAAPAGTPIHAPADATVSIADDYFLDGGFTLLDHGHGVSTCYLHQSRRVVKAGDAVKQGQVIGYVGQTGRATGPHSHWGLNWFQMKLDPSLSTRTPLPPKA